MKQKYVPVYIAVGFVLLVGIFYIVKFTASKIPAVENLPPAATATHPGEKSVLVRNITNTDGTKYTRVNVQYPRFEGVASIVNAEIDKFVSEYLVAFRKNSEENWKARFETKLPGETVSEFPSDNEKFYASITWKFDRMDDKYISITLNAYEFSGGAHGSATVHSINYDVKNNKLMTLADLYPGKPDYLKKISDGAIESLNAQLLAQEDGTQNVALRMQIEEGAGPDLKNFEAFTHNENVLTIYFQQYQVGPYAIGMPKVELPIDL